MKQNVLETIGSPMVCVSSPEGATVAAKLEARNPGGSAKDRPALYMVRAAERAGELDPGDRVVEATSGNTGIGLAVACSTLGYDLTIVMPRSKSEERRQLLAAYGAEVELVDGDVSAARERAAEIAASEGAVEVRQFENPANPEAHYHTTGEEILEQVGERDIDAFVAGVGTGGTLMGTGRRLREAFPDVDLVAVEPESNAPLARGQAGTDDFQGMGPGFVSDIVDPDLIDDVETVALGDAEREARRLARKEGILVGQSSGAASIAASQVAERLAQPELECPPAPSPTDIEGVDPELVESDGGPDYDDCPLVVTVFPDSGERYLSTGLFDD